VWRWPLVFAPLRQRAFYDINTGGIASACAIHNRFGVCHAAANFVFFLVPHCLSNPER
jgi:hypothetical protein